ncbi:MAG: UDP-4-amino-4,6-dideoxy-N-acetyl-beta-L-altrosamine transaminase [Dissulfuribacterales bacterium]
MTINKKKYIPCGRQSIDEDDIQAVVEVLRSDYLTTGPKVAEFEKAVADCVGVKYAVAVSSGTAALHCAMYALGIGPGDEVIVPPMTFAATANCVVYQGGTPVFADVEEDTLLIDPAEVEKKITPRTKAIIGVDYAGQPCDWDSLRAIADKYNLAFVADGCHALGAEYKGRRVGSLADMTAFSFHPVKHITTGEGGMITTDNPEYTQKLKLFRNHGIATDHHQREEKGTWFYEMLDLGYNYRITDFQCALGISQLKKLPAFLARRQQIAAMYGEGFQDDPTIIPLTCNNEIFHAYHLYVVKVARKPGREMIFNYLRAAGIAVNIHYIPVHLHPFYRTIYGYEKGSYPVAEAAYDQILSLPIWPGLSDEQVDFVLKSIQLILEKS